MAARDGELTGGLLFGDGKLICNLLRRSAVMVNILIIQSFTPSSVFTSFYQNIGNNELCV